MQSHNARDVHTYECLLFFFFQAEDGIRDLVRSRGLGDVYKRQRNNDAEQIKVDHGHAISDSILRDEHFQVPGVGGRRPSELSKTILCPVSYTHLTLPTSDLV